MDEARALGAGSVAYTYVEPTVFLEYALDVGRLAHEAGLRNLFITDGYATPEAVDLLAPVLDAANVDLKSFDDAFYRKLCGARLAPVLESIVAMRRAGIWLELTTLVIPGRNDDDRQLRSLARWIVETLGPETPWHVSRFHPAYRLLDVAPTPLTTLRRVADLGREAGLAHVYVGNAPELGLEDTRCAGCGRVVIERHGYATRNRLTAEGTCVGCGRALAGRRPRRSGGGVGVPDPLRLREARDHRSAPRPWRAPSTRPNRAGSRRWSPGCWRPRAARRPASVHRPRRSAACWPGCSCRTRGWCTPGSSPPRAGAGSRWPGRMRR